jgi:hypothetical protein
MRVLKNILKKFRRGNSTVDDSMEQTASMNRKMSATFIERTYDLKEFAQRFPQSGINVNNPNLSTGLSTGKYIFASISTFQPKQSIGHFSQRKKKVESAFD